MPLELLELPAIKPQIYANADEYRKSNSPTVNHFYEKLLLLKDMMLTPTGRLMAQQRHHFMEDFLKQFFIEVEEGELNIGSD